MKFLILFSALAVMATSVLGLVVVGPSGSVQPRYEIRQLNRDFNMQYSILILAMIQWQKQPASNLKSYAAIAGIHGAPKVSYDGVGQCSACRGAEGYCTHDSILFLAWHRAYLSLFEQELVAVAKQIALTYPSGTARAQAQAAANKLRMPYWDWAARPPSGNNMPSEVTSQTVSVKGPKGMQSVANPFYKYTFQTTKNLLAPPFTLYPHTLRYPSSNSASATSNDAKAIQAFNNIRGTLQDQLYQIFSTCDTYSEVGLDTVSTGTKKCFTSLESLHGAVHNTAGGLRHNGISGGHMAYLTWAGFDPIFWLHHCNIDRLFALWQGVYPNSYGGSQPAQAATWTIAQGSVQNSNSPLTPFHKNGGGFLTTLSMRKWQNFGYTYPEYLHSDGSSAAISKYINKLYGPNAGATAGSSKRDELTDVTTPLVANNGSLFQYVANIQTTRYALNGSYNIYLFNGNPTTEETSEWILDPNLIGPLGVLATDAMTENNLVATGAIPLTRVLSDMVAGGVIPDLTEAIVVPYLAQTLQWRIADPNGQEVDPTSVPDFDISVYASTATQANDGSLPVWSDFIELQDITQNLDQPPASSNSTSTATGSTTTSTSLSTSLSTTTSTSTMSAVSAPTSTGTMMRRARRS